jgi:hypothetical protein
MMMMMGGDWPKEKLFMTKIWLVVVDCANAKGGGSMRLYYRKDAICNMEKQGKIK